MLTEPSALKHLILVSRNVKFSSTDDYILILRMAKRKPKDKLNGQQKYSYARPDQFKTMKQAD